jgi:cobalt-zinc-cadmium efflux system outer membrane protein
MDRPMFETGTRLRRRALAALVALAAVPACTTISSRDNAARAGALAARQEPAAAPWRRDAQAEVAAEARISELVRDGITAQESVAICFLAHPDVQLAFETLEISRSELVAASTPPNPVAILGTRTPGGNLSAFFPQRNVTVGVLQNVLALVNLPSRRRIAGIELDRARLEAADRLVALAAEVNEAYIDYVAALRIDALRREAAMSARAILELQRQQLERAPGSEAELLSERYSMLQVEGAAVRSALDVATARARLAQLMGLAGRRDDWQSADVLPALPAVDPVAASLEQTALDQRLDLQASRRAVEARLDAAGVQRRWRWLGAAEIGVFRESASGGTRFTGPNAMIELPLFDQRQAQILAASAEWRAALRRLESQFLAARTEIRTHAAELATTRQLLARYDADLLPALRRMGELQGGASLDGRRTAFAALSAEEERVGLLRDYWRAYGALARSAGDWRAMPEWPKVTQNGAQSP